MKVGRLFSLKLRAVINRINVAVKLRNLKGKSDRNVFVIFLNTKKFSTFHSFCFLLAVDNAGNIATSVVVS
jgi:hypothetical protein